MNPLQRTSGGSASNVEWQVLLRLRGQNWVVLKLLPIRGEYDMTRIQSVSVWGTGPYIYVSSDSSIESHCSWDGFSIPRWEYTRRPGYTVAGTAQSTESRN